ncbi:MAG: hypothetical protein JWM19_5174 [Actinomycetia bacterium]|nr:hypothetical protein [Actinomycetes bacterium]
MRQYLPVAVIEVSEESLRLIAGDEVPGALAELRADLKSALDAHEEDASSESGYGEWYPSGPTGTLVMAHELHLAACRAAPPDPVALADRLVSARLSTGWGIFTDGPAKYADVLGPAGLARCTELLEQQGGNKSRALAELRGSLARAQATLAVAGS